MSPMCGGRPASAFADVAQMFAQHHPTVGKLVGQRRRWPASPTSTRLGDRRRADTQLRDGLGDVPGFELVDPGQPVTAADQDRRGHPFDDVAHVAAGHLAVVERRQAWP